MAAGGGESVDLWVGWTGWSARVEALGMHGGREGEKHRFLFCGAHRAHNAGHIAGQQP